MGASKLLVRISTPFIIGCAIWFVARRLFTSGEVLRLTWQTAEFLCLDVQTNALCVEMYIPEGKRKGEQINCGHTYECFDCK